MLAASIQPIVSFMVVVSIVIHGLSIPFFSLGRRVRTMTRTWSLHSGAMPEWAAQTRPVTRGEDIVINRDPVSALERGEGVLALEKREADGAGIGTGENGQMKPRRGSESDESRTPAGTGTPDEKDADPGGHGEVRGGIPPDGDTVLAEWIEGPDRIVERRAGPGEEVGGRSHLLM